MKYSIKTGNADITAAITKDEPLWRKRSLYSSLCATFDH